MTWDDPFLDALEPILRTAAKRKRHQALDNARAVIELEDWVRRWPYVSEVVDADREAAAWGRRLRQAPEHVRQHARDLLWWRRFNIDPTISEMVRCGVEFAEADRRMEERLRQFESAFRGS